MTLASEFKISDNNIIRCYINKKKFSENTFQADSLQTLSRLSTEYVNKKNTTMPLPY